MNQMSLSVMRFHFESLWLILLAVSAIISAVQAEGFTFPTSQIYEFIVGDLVNVSWDVATPRFSLYEVCDTAIILESNSTSTSSYVWNATRAYYLESGCVFELEPLDIKGTPHPPNLTSVIFGVSKRYASDPAPTEYNFGGSQASTSTSVLSSTVSSATSTISTSTTAPADASAATTIAATTTSSKRTAGGLSSAQKVGIGVGVPLAVISLFSIGLLGMWYRRRTRSHSTNQDHAGQDEAGTMKNEKAEMEAKSPSSALFSDNISNQNYNRVSGADTLVSELSSQNYDNNRDSMLQRPISELMGTPKAEMG